jgi:cell division protein FtsL
MSRFATVSMVLLAVASAFVLYAMSYETRRLELHVGALARTAEKASLDIAVLRAERAYLARPDRIEDLARKIGLAPIEPRQYELIPAATPAPGRRQP